MTPRLDDRLAPDVTLRLESDRRLHFDAGERGSLTLAPPASALAEALGELADGLTATARAAFEQRPDFDTFRFEYYLLRLRKRRMLEVGLKGHDGDLLVVVPHREGFAPAADPPPDEAVLRLSRFAYLHATERGPVLDSPEAACTVVMSDPRTLLWIHDLANGATPHLRNDPDAEERAAFADLLWRCRFLEDADAPEAPARASWEFHDLLFHRASRPGAVLWSFGGGYRFEDRFPSPPAVKPAFDGERITLDMPEMAALSKKSGRLLNVMERRRSFRTMGETPISLSQITEFLFRVARFVEVIESPKQETAIRVFPSGGAIHEIEFYLSVRQCEGLAPGFYHYHAFDHALDRVPGAEEHAATIVGRAGEDWNQPEEPPQVVVTLASRLPRLAWKYDTVAYRATLMNTGVVVQTMYLVATDMDLGCAPAGRGDPAVFAAATGLDPFEETSILEFGIGTRDSEAESLLDAAAAQFGTRRRTGRGPAS